MATRPGARHYSGSDHIQIDTAPEQLAILISIADELKEELSIMATVRQMIELSRNEIAIGPWHETWILTNRGVRLQDRSVG